ncbi:MAG: glucose 1-dehydrogenase [Trueperaceae bacterium]|jgi:NAD(P)-dependent dehydrogenase (short-subunit alcohol dehydrogenase family)
MKSEAMNAKKLDGRVAIVSGSGANIGEACARALAAAGAKVVLADINFDGATQVARDIVDNGGEAFAYRLDLVDEDNIRGLVAQVLERYGRIDILHNNAADTRIAQMAADGPITDLAADVWDRAYTVNTRGTMLMIKHCVPAMIEAGGGSIINTSSGTSLLGDVFNPAYSSSKAAVNALTRNVAAQFGKQNIRCNAILPGMIVTPLAREMLPAAMLEMLERHTLLPRLGRPDDIAGAVVFLASDDASFVTGQLFAVDGGITTHQPFVGEVLAQQGG